MEKDKDQILSFNKVFKTNYENHVKGRINTLQQEINKFMVSLTGKTKYEQIDLLKCEIGRIESIKPYYAPQPEDLHWELDLMKTAYNLLKGNYTGRLKQMLFDLLFDNETQSLLKSNAKLVIGVLLKETHR